MVLTVCESYFHETAGSVSSAKLAEFLGRLAIISHEAGLGITDEPTVYVLESGDEDRTYTLDGESRLIFR